MKKRGAVDFDVLPEGCISNIISFTSPRDACRSSLVSSIFQSAADSDAVWEKFLPSDYEEIISQSVPPFPVGFSSKKDLYLRLCNHPILIDEGHKSFELKKWSGKKCYMLAARKLSIEWGNDTRYWKWKSLPGSRFSEVAALRMVCLLEIHGKIETRILSSKTTYAAYLVFKLTDRTYGLDLRPVMVYVGFGGDENEGAHPVYLDPHGSLRQEHRNIEEGDVDWLQWEIELPRERGDGWMEIEMGEFFNDQGGDGEVEMSLKGIEALYWKYGLIVQGIELRPKE